MTRYYFDVHDKEGTYTDDVGLELPDMEAAIVEARRALADMTKELMIDPDATGIHIVIHDGEAGLVELSVSMRTTWPGHRAHRQPT